MAERKLPNRKRKSNPGRVIRVSKPVYDLLEKGRAGRSWDLYIRHTLGLPDRAGNKQPLLEGLLEPTTGRLFLKFSHITWETLEEDAYEVAFIAAAKQKLKRVGRPIRMREVR